MKIKYYIKWILRSSAELLSLKRCSFAKQKAAPGFSAEAWYNVEVTMPIITPPGQEAMFANKMHNIRLAIERIHLLMIRPREIFSFWHTVGRPTARSGFMEGTSFINGEIKHDIGGGLCQISSAIYCAAFRFGLKIVERRAHSIDAYDEKRYFPLGQDATVVFPHVDLQVQNIHRDNVIIQCFVSDNAVVATISTPRQCCTTDIATEILQKIPKKTVYRKKSFLGEKASTAAQNGSDGKIVRTTRTIAFADNRQSLGDEYIDEYQPVDEIQYQ